MSRCAGMRPGGVCRAVALGLTVLLGACYPASDRETVADYDVVMTWYQRTYGFGTATTYTMEDKVQHICPPDDPDCTFDPENEQLMLDTVADTLAALGYERVPFEGPSTDADLDVTLRAAATEVTGSACACAWYPEWYYWSPWCYVVPYSFDVGTLWIDMLDMRHPDPAGQTLPVIWAAAMNGLLGDTGTDMRQRIVAGIHEAFAQSPYLAAGES